MPQPKTLTKVSDLDHLPFPAGRVSKQVFEADGVELRHYAPKGVDTQVPHDRDELYFVISGTGTFKREAEKVPCGPGDVLFVAAHEDHRFLDFSSDFQVWVVFYGPVRAK